VSEIWIFVEFSIGVAQSPRAKGAKQRAPAAVPQAFRDTGEEIEDKWLKNKRLIWDLKGLDFVIHFK
jgi:hypothetical protein